MSARACVVGVILAVSAGGLAGCGSSSSSSSSGSSSASPTAVTTSSVSSATSSGGAGHVARPAATAVAHALLATRTTPRLSGADCRVETAAQRAGSPFGSTGSPVYACGLSRGGARVDYDVQVLPSGCFVAERRKPGTAIYGCGVARP